MDKWPARAFLWTVAPAGHLSTAALIVRRDTLLNWLVLISLLTGSLPGIIAGSHASTWVPDVVLRPILAITLMIVAGMMII